MTQYLTNGNFEADWGDEQSHRTHVFPYNADSFITDVDNIFTPPGWTTWFFHEPDEWDQPEVRDAWKQNDERRVHSGEKSILLFTFFRKHDAGFYQQVAVPIGTRLRLSGYAHAWSNQHEPYLDDPKWSEGAPVVGYNEVSVAAADVPPLNDNEQNDAIGNFNFTLGIDPTGGTDPFAPTVIWGNGVSNYNKHFAVPSVEVVATSNYMTVFLRSRTLWAFKHNDAYWDTISLVDVDTPPGPEPECKGLPRIDFARHYNVLPKTATGQQAVAVFLNGWREGRQTTGGSYDDAGIGDLKKKVAFLYGIPPADRPEFVKFYQLYYPDTLIDFRDLPGEPPLPTGLLVWQCDPRWGNEQIAGHDCTSTLCQNGCFVTCGAIAQRYYEIDKVATSSTANQLLGADGFSGCRATWAAFKNRLDVEVVRSTTDLADVNAWLTHDIAFAEVAPTSYEHFVVITRVENGRFWMVDPYRNVEGWYDEYYEGVDSWRLVKKADSVTPPEPPTEPHPHISLHLQTMIGGWEEYVRDVHPPACKVLASFEDVFGVLGASNGETMPVARQPVTNGYDEVLNAPTAREAAAVWIGYVEEGLHVTCDRIEQRGLPHQSPHYFYWESMNELYASSHPPTLAWVIEIETAMCHLLHEIEPRVGLVVYNAAIGNIEPYHYDWLVPLGKAAQLYDHWFGYHSYWLAHRVDTDWKWLAGRWTEIDKVLVANGVKIKWHGGEGGAVGGHVVDTGGYVLLPNDGWRSNESYNGDWNAYLADIMLYDAMCYEWNQTHGGRYLCCGLFTEGEDYVGWPSFKLWGDELRPLAQALVERYYT